MKRIFLTAVAAILAMASALAQSDALPFTRIERDPASAGMAGASLSSTSTAAYSAFRNAAVLPFAAFGHMDVAASYQIWSPDVAHTTNLQAGFAYKLSDHTGVSLGFVSQAGEAYDELNGDGSVVGSITPKDMVAALGLGIGLTESLSLGINARYALQKLAPDATYNGVSGDVYVLFHPSEALNLTAGLSTLGTSIKSVTKKTFSQPASVVLAGSYNLPLAEDHALEANLSADYYFSGNYGVALGAEYAWKGMVLARAGYRMASKEAVIPSHAAVGLGARWKGFRLDVSYLTASRALGNTLSLGIGYSF